MRQMRKRQTNTTRRGFSLSELLLAITITILVFAAAVPFFTLQLRALASDVGRNEAQQTARFAQNTLDRELRNVGIGTTPLVPTLGIPRNQPKIVQADQYAVTFNTDLVASDTSDVEAVYIDPNVDTTLTLAMQYTNSIALPRTSKLYPDFVYRKADGSLSYAETVSYWVVVDTAAGYADEYKLYRRINDGAATVVANGIQIPAGQPFFRYTRVNSSGQVVAIAPASLPIYWDATGGIADSIRTVTVDVNGVYRGRNLKNDTVSFKRRVNSQTSLMNIGLAQRGSCGDLPLNPGTPVATIIWAPGPVKDHIELTWTASADEAGGEKDVERYAVFRRPITQALFDEPIAVIGKGSVNYSFDDFDLQPGTTFVYGVAAQDCSPANSTILVSNPVPH
jgi:type II secretory pathway pseudopilin PulG